jgi:hypothetical protein
LIIFCPTIGERCPDPKDTPIAGNAGGSEKSDKQDANQRLRSAVRVALRRGEELMPDLPEVSDPWLMAKDGRH